MRLLAVLVVLAFGGVGYLFYVMTEHVAPPSHWSYLDTLEYKWFVFRGKLGWTLSEADRGQFLKMIDEEINARKSRPTSYAADWIGHVYPDKSNLLRSEFIGGFDTLDACRILARTRLGQLNALEAGDYECGFSCEWSGLEDGIWICDKTTR